MIFNIGYIPMDRSYHEHAERSIGKPPPEPTLTTGELGSSTVEIPGQQDLLAGARAEIRKGVGQIELATVQGGPGQATSPESYGNEAREAIRELAEVSEAKFTSVHIPTSVNGLSGFDPQSGKFNEQYRKMATDELSQGIKFAGDVVRGGGVVVHAGEYQRPISEEDWAVETLPDGRKRYKFMSHMGEPDTTVMTVVDKTDGSVKGIAQKNKTLVRPRWQTADHDYRIYNNRKQRWDEVHKGDYIDIDGGNANDDPFERVPLYDRENNKWLTEQYGWKQVEHETNRWNRENPHDQITPEVMFYRIHMENQIAQQKGQSAYYSQDYENSLERYKKIKEAIAWYEDFEKRFSPEERKKIEIPKEYGALVPPGTQMPSELLKQQLVETDRRLKHAHEAAANAEVQAEQIKKEMHNIVPVQDYALEQTRKTLAQAGVEAWEETQKNPYVKDGKDIFLSVENVDPALYGSHPDEIIRIIKEGRKEMVKYLTEKNLEVNGETVENPWYKGLSKDEAEKYASKHIKMNFDTEHLAMWRKKFVPQQGWDRDKTNEEFKKWYMEQVKKLAKEDIIGHIHLVDSNEGGHMHIPPGQGQLPLNDVVKELKKAGYKGTVISEGFGENRRYGVDRQITSAWRYFGTPITSFGGARAPNFAQISNYYFGRGEAPMYIVGAYVPSNEWTLWSQVPLE